MNARILSSRLALTALALALTACEREGASSTVSAERPLVVLIVVDALRADHLGVYGYDRPTSPALDAFAGESVRFETAYSTSSWTKPSIPSLLTSLYPARHRVYEGNAHARGGRLESDLLADEAWTLAEAMSECGYETAGIVHNAHLRSEFGFAQGFDHYEERSARSPELIGLLRDWIAGRRASGDRPLFAYLHLLDVHWPYEPPAAPAELFGVDPGWADEPGLRDAVNRGHLELTPAHVDGLIRRYDAEIRGTDDALSPLLDDLSAAFGADPVVVLTSDHGEGFLEHDYLGHGRDLYEESVRVPLLLRLPRGRGAGSVVSHSVSTLDVMPTLLELAGCPAPAERDLDGESLLQLLDAPDGAGERLHLAEVRHGQIYREAFWDGTWKLVRTTRTTRQPADAALVRVDPKQLVGQRFEVEGLRVAEGKFVADGIEAEEAGDTDDEVTGILEAFDPIRLEGKVNGFHVDLREAALLGPGRRPIALDAAHVGSPVKIEGQARDARRFVADKLVVIEGRSGQELEGLVADARYSGESEVELVIAALRVSIERDDLFEALGGRADEPGSSGETGVFVTVELFDLATDPAERTDLAASRPRLAAGLLESLDARKHDLAGRAIRPSSRVALDDGTVDALRGLGYVE